MGRFRPCNLLPGRLGPSDRPEERSGSRLSLGGQCRSSPAGSSSPAKSLRQLLCKKSGEAPLQEAGRLPERRLHEQLLCPRRTKTRSGQDEGASQDSLVPVSAKGGQSLFRLCDKRPRRKVLRLPSRRRRGSRSSGDLWPGRDRSWCGVLRHAFNGGERREPELLPEGRKETGFLAKKALQEKERLQQPAKSPPESRTDSCKDLGPEEQLPP